MKPAHLRITFRECVRITFLNKLTVRTNKDNYLDMTWMCIWCRAQIYIGHCAKDVPEDLQAYFLSPQQFEEYKHLCEEFKEGTLEK